MEPGGSMRHSQGLFNNLINIVQNQPVKETKIHLRAVTPLQWF